MTSRARAKEWLDKWSINSSDAREPDLAEALDAAERRGVERALEAAEKDANRYMHTTNYLVASGVANAIRALLPATPPEKP